jgi:UDP-N-acetylmuramoyl-L-alanyl-D-glutamate--2,6-diaminopimelate ligase
MTELAYPSGLQPRPGLLGLQALGDQLQRAIGARVVAHRMRDVAIEGLAVHSDEVRPGSLFFAVRGTHADGAAFVPRALQRGAVAIVAERDLPVPCPVLEVPDVRQAVGESAAFYYGHPSRRVTTVGITGTNGKTTTAHLLRACLEEGRLAAGVIGTTGIEYGRRRIPTHNTTPGPIQIHGHLQAMAERRLQACVMEVSSHALDQDRVRGVRFAAGVFLNLTQDHLDYHGDMQSYARAKARLFALLAPGAHACIAGDMPGAAAMLAAVAPGVQVHRFGLDPNCEVHALNLEGSLEGTRFEIVMPRGRVDLMLRLPGVHNVRNALAAASAALALGVSELTIAAALDRIRPVRGRLELAGYRAGIRAFVDYAHTPDALQNVCSTLRRLTAGNLIVVFGCGGDRDRGKRPLMTLAVARHADVAIMTSDNPRGEAPEAILDEMAAGLESAAGAAARCSFFRVVDRGEAIREAVARAAPGDTVLIAGKGHETYQILRDAIVEFDDLLVAREALARREAAG